MEIDSQYNRPFQQVLVMFATLAWLCGTGSSCKKNFDFLRSFHTKVLECKASLNSLHAFLCVL